MQLTQLDWLVVVACLVAAFSPALFLIRRAGRGTAEFFATGRSAPWWLIGTSMVATTFATDTPLLVTNIVRKDGVAGNWAWWALLLTGMVTVFFYARLWRRSGVLTDLEFYELRYSGRSAAFVRGFRAIYLGLFYNCVTMAIVTLAATKIANVMLGWQPTQTVIFCVTICLAFSVIAGLWGVLATDLVQFAIAMAGVTAAAFYALDHPAVGGLHGMLDKIDPRQLALLPDFSNTELTLTVLIIPLTVQWWAAWYPGAEPGGGSYIAQRMLAARDERHALVATLWFNVAHYALRPWPWIIVALCSLLVFPTLDDIQRALPHVSADLLDHDLAYPAMLTLLPAGVLGLLIASLLAAYVSTMSTQLNWGASYLVHDFYRRFLKPDASERHYVWVSRLATAGLLLVATSFMFFINTAKEGFDLLIQIGAGTGLIYLLRWFWWRVNAWSEIVAMAASFVCAASVVIARKAGLVIPSHWGLVGSVGVTTAAWLAVTFLTAPVDGARLLAFYRLVRPGGPGWRGVQAEAGVGPSPDSLPHALLCVVLGCTFIYSALFGAGNFIYGYTVIGTICTVLFAGSGLLLVRLLSGLWKPART